MHDERLAATTASGNLSSSSLAPTTDAEDIDFHMPTDPAKAAIVRDLFSGVQGAESQ